MTPEDLNFHKEILQKELGLIQDVIKRMAANSFQIKAWAIGLFSAIVAFSLDKLANQQNPTLGLFVSLLLLVPVCSFWWIDAFFLKTEQLYRNLYAWVVNYRMLNKEIYLYDLNTFKRQTKTGEKNTDGIEIITEKNITVKKGVLGVMLSKTLLPFYAIPLIFVILLVCYNLILLIKQL